MALLFTPGPWKLRRDAAGNEYGAIYGADDALVATTGFRVAVGSSEDMGNAHLIASAPQLLEALSLVRMSAGWQYLSDEARAVIVAALSRANP
jgi:hypothetical protein